MHKPHKTRSRASRSASIVAFSNTVKKLLNSRKKGLAKEHAKIAKLRKRTDREFASALVNLQVALANINEGPSVREAVADPVMNALEERMRRPLLGEPRRDPVVAELEGMMHKAHL